MTRTLKKLGRFLVYGGFGGPKPYEAEMLEAVVAALSASDARVLRQQIAAIERLQRWNEDRMVIVGFEDKDVLPVLGNQETDHCLATLRLSGDFGSLKATVMTHRGILSSLEFRRSPRKMEGRAFSVELVEIHATDLGASRAIDAEEHDPPA